MKRVWKVGLGITLAFLVTVVAGLACILNVELDSPRLGREILAQVSEQTGVHLTAQRFRLHLLSGLELDGVKATSELPTGKVTASIDRLLLLHELGPLIRGHLVIDEVRLERPEIELVTTEAPPAKADQSSPSTPSTPAAPVASRPHASPAPGPGFALEVHEISLDDANLLSRTEGSDEPPTEIRGLSITLHDLSLPADAPSALQGLRAQGEMTAREVLAGGLQGHDAHGRVELGEGHLRIEELAFTTDLGPFAVRRLDVDLNRDPFTFSLAAGGDPLDVQALLGGGSVDRGRSDASEAHAPAPAATGAQQAAGLGPGRLEIEVTGDGSGPAALHGEGRLHLAAGSLPDLPLLEAVDSIVGGTPLVGAPYEALDAPFHLAGERLEIPSFELGSGSFRLGLAGWADLEGTLDLHLSLHIRKQEVRIHEIPAEALDVLTDEEGYLLLPLVATGTVERPRVAPDGEVLAAAARHGLQREAQDRAGKAVRKKADDLLRQLLGGDG